MCSYGYLHVVTGCMFSGKTTHLLQEFKRNELSSMIITHSMDTRYGTAQIISHTYESCDAMPVNQLMPLVYTLEYSECTHILVDEAQFFPDLYEFVIHAVEYDNKKVTVYGLDGDYKREPFGEILRVIPLANSIVKLNAICKRCNDGTHAIFSLRKTDSDEQIKIGTHVDYEPVCRHHYLLSQPYMQNGIRIRCD